MKGGSSARALRALGLSTISSVLLLAGRPAPEARGIAARPGPPQSQASQPNRPRGEQPNPDRTEVHSLHVQGSVYMLVGAGGNITVQAGDDGVLVVDTSLAGMSDKVVAEIRKLSGKPIYWIVNTAVDADHVGGNENLSKPNPDYLAPAGVQIVAHENVLTRMSAPTGAPAPFPAAFWPTDTYAGRQKEIFFNNEPVIVMHQPAAHTDGDSLVFFRRSDVVSTGDVFQTTTYPVIDVQRGGSLAGIINAANNILDITIPKEKQEGGTYVIPGHGRLCDEHDVLEYRDMLTIIRDRVQDAVKKGMTLEQLKAMKPTLDYDGRWGAATGPWTTDMFLAAAYAEARSGTSKVESGNVERGK